MCQFTNKTVVIILIKQISYFSDLGCDASYEKDKLINISIHNWDNLKIKKIKPEKTPFENFAIKQCSEINGST